MQIKHCQICRRLLVRDAPHCPRCGSRVMNRAGPFKVPLSFAEHGVLRVKRREYSAARADFLQAIAVDPGDTWSLNNLAWLLATCEDSLIRDGPAALEYAKDAAARTGFAQSSTLDTLAAAYAAVGDFKSAVKWAKSAVKLAPVDRTADCTARLAAYRQQQPWRVAP